MELTSFYWIIVICIIWFICGHFWTCVSIPITISKELIKGFSNLIFRYWFRNWMSFILCYLVYYIFKIGLLFFYFELRSWGIFNLWAIILGHYIIGIKFLKRGNLESIAIRILTILNWVIRISSFKLYNFIRKLLILKILLLFNINIITIIIIINIMAYWDNRGVLGLRY